MRISYALGRTTSIDVALKLVRIWNESSFEKGRHQSRIDQLDHPLITT